MRVPISNIKVGCGITKDDPFNLDWLLFLCVN